jgi:hypothetical protein
MINKNSLNSSVFQELIKRIKKIIRLFKKSSRIHSHIFEGIQLTFIYFFAIVVLIYTIKNSLGYIPEILYTIIPFLQQVLDFELLKILASPEKTFILYLLVLELLINRSSFQFSLLVKFNVLLIFILEMLQNLIISYWDLLFSRELEIFSTNLMIPKNTNSYFFSLLFLTFLGLYLSSYIRGLKGLFPSFPGILQAVVESVAFWLQIKILKDPKK